MRTIEISHRSSLKRRCSATVKVFGSEMGTNVAASGELVVGIGGLTGGLEAFVKRFDAMAIASGLARRDGQRK